MSDGARESDRVAELFDQVADLPFEEAKAVLDAECADAPAVKAEVLELLAFDPKKNAPSDTRPDPAMMVIAAPPSRVPDELPSRIDRFVIRRKLGAGGMGVVYEARDPVLDRPVALKLVLPDRSGRWRGGAGRLAEAQRRLLREAQAMARVAHPNVVPIYEAGLHDDAVFVTMELVTGQTLSAWAANEPRTWQAIMARLVEAGRGLAAAHAAGILHRDFKPDNVLIGVDDRARVLDFGLARALARSGDRDAIPAEDGAAESPSAIDEVLTMEGAIMGTPSFMSPEHFRGPMGPEADQWSFGVTAYRLLFGVVPFRGSLLEIQKAVEQGPPPPPASASGDIPPRVTDAILRSLSPNREDRFASVAEMVTELEAALAAELGADASIARRHRRRASAIIGALGALNFLGAGIRTSFAFDLGIGGLIVQSVVGLAITLLTVAVYRRALLGTRHNQRVIAVFVIVLATHLVHRLHALAVGGSVTSVLRDDALITAALAALAAFTMERWFLWVAALAGAYVAVTFAWERAIVPGFGLFLVGSVLVGVARWREPSPARRRGERRSGERSQPTTVPQTSS